MSKGAKHWLLFCGALLVLGTLGAVVAVVWPYACSGGVGREIARLRAQGKLLSAIEENPQLDPRFPESRRCLSEVEETMFSSRAILSELLEWRGPRNAQFWHIAQQHVTACGPALALIAETLHRPDSQFSPGWLALELKHQASRWIVSRIGSDPKDTFRLTIQDSTFGPPDAHHFLLGVAWTFGLRAELLARNGRCGESAADLETISRMANAIRNRRSAAGVVWQSSFLSIASDALHGALSSGQLDAAQIRQIYNSLGEVDLHRGFIRGLVGERAAMIALFAKLRTQRIPDQADTGEHQSLFRRCIVIPVIRTKLRAEETAFLRQMAGQISEARLASMGLPAHEKRAVAPRWQFSAELQPMIDRARAARDRGLASQAGSRLALALEAHRLRFGSYPETLGELRKRLGWRIEKDPFSGRDFVYRRLPRGFLLYSLEKNLKDDSRIPAGKWLPRELIENSDLVWRVVR